MIHIQGYEKGKQKRTLDQKNKAKEQLDTTQRGPVMRAKKLFLFRALLIVRKTD